MHARLALFFYFLPRLGLPLCDLLLVALSRPQTGSLQAPAHALKDLPNVSGVIAHPCKFFDQCRNPRQRPQIRFVPMGERSTKKLLLHQLQLLRLHARLSPGLCGPRELLGVPSLPRQPPFANALTAGPQRMSDRGLPFPLFE